MFLSACKVGLGFTIAVSGAPKVIAESMAIYNHDRLLSERKKLVGIKIEDR